MAKTSKKALGMGLAGVMSVGAFSGAISAINQVNAAESKAQEDAKGIIAHSIMSINKWYAGIKNQATWEGYVREARGYISKMPASESAQAAELTKQVDGIQDVITAIACINQVEKSLAPVSEGGFGNYHGIKNVAQWQDYLKKAQEAMKGIDLSSFQSKYDELLQRFNKVSGDVKEIEDKHYADLAKVEEKYESAKKNASLEEAKKALEEAKKLGTHESSTEIVKKIEELIAELNKSVSVTGASIVDTKNIKLEGTGLHNLKASDITVEGCTVDSVKVSADLKSLNVALKDEITPNIERSIKVKIDGKEVEFKVTLGVEVKTIEVKSADYSHNKANQKLTLIVNGKEMTVDYLKAAGYKVNFVATTTRGAIANIFEGNNNTSESGIIANNIPATSALVGTKHKVEVQLTKDSNVIISSKADIGIYNLDAVSEITNVSLVNINPSWMSKVTTDMETGFVKYDDNTETDKDKYFIDSTNSMFNRAYTMKGNTLVSGEVATIAGVYTKDGDKERSLGEGTVSVESSDPSVISVNKNALPGYATWQLKAGNKGTATITVKVGDKSKTVNLTVTNEKRYLAKMEMEKNSIDIVNNRDVARVKIKTVDQYGEPIGVVDLLEHQAGGDDYAHVPGFSSATAGGNSFSVKGGVVTTTSNQDKPMFAEIFINTRDIVANEFLVGEGYIDLDNSVITNLNPLEFEGRAATYTIKNTFINPNTNRPVGNSLGQLTIRNIGATSIGSYKLAYADNKSNVIKTTDGQVDASLESYTTTEHLINGQVDLTNCTVESTVEDVAKVVKNTSNTGIEITPNNPGETTIIIKKNTGEILIQEKITVKDESKENLISSVSFKNMDITYSDTIYTIYDFMDVEKRSNGEDDVVNGITLTKTVNSKIRIARTTTPLITQNDLYIDYDGDGKYSTGDKIIGKVTADKIGMSGSPEGNIGSGYFGSSAISDEGVYHTPSNAVTGKLSIKVIESTSGNHNVVGTKLFEINVK